MDAFTDQTGGVAFHHYWTQLAQDEPPETALESPLLDLARSSDVDPIKAEQVADARLVLRLRRKLVQSPGADPGEILGLQRRIVARFLAGRRERFGADQCAPLADVPALAHEGRDVFVVIKFMDESPHIAATVQSLLNQRHLDLGRLVIVTVDNNSTDGSDDIVRRMAAANGTQARVVCINQPTPGAGNAARLGVDRVIATIYQMCQHDQRWDRLQNALIGVSDGDTVYHPDVVSEAARILADNPAVDGLMPFLVYKFTAALRLFPGYTPAYPDDLQRCADMTAAQRVSVPLADLTAYDLLPRWQRVRTGEGMELGIAGGGSVTVPLVSVDGHGRRFGVLRDPDGRIGYVLADRTLVLAQVPVSGFDAALVFLENGGVRAADKWRWHALVAHDLFLYWAFVGLGLPEEMVYPDTSDALKMFRAWSFAIGGQHQLTRPDLRIATGSDYQSGRVLQAVGCTVRLGPAHAFAETETDRLIKMARNMARRQNVFYGQTRSDALERATGLYVHMTRIQGEIERELRGYADEVFEHTIFPERVLFPLRWMLQNAIRFYAHPGGQARQIVRDRVLATMLDPRTVTRIQQTWLGEPSLAVLRAASNYQRQAIAEGIAEEIIGTCYPEIMSFYQRTLRSFCQAQRVAPEHYEWLLDGLTESHNAILEKPASVHPAAVWQDTEFVIDEQRGQVLRLREGA